MIVAQLLPETALSAMKKGITSDNMVRYLESSAHPRSLKRTREGDAIVPGNVQEQLSVWESSRSRTTSTKGVLFEWARGEPDAASQFQSCKSFAHQSGGLLWATPSSQVRAQGDGSGASRLRLVVRESSAMAVRKCIAGSAKGA